MIKLPDLQSIFTIFPELSLCKPSEDDDNFLSFNSHFAPVIFTPSDSPILNNENPIAESIEEEKGLDFVIVVTT